MCVDLCLHPVCVDVTTKFRKHYLEDSSLFSQVLITWQKGGSKLILWGLSSGHAY